MVLVATAAVWMALMRTPWNRFQMVWTATRKVPTWQSYIGIAQMGLAVSLSMLTLVAPGIASSGTMIVEWPESVNRRGENGDALRRPAAGSNLGNSSDLEIATAPATAATSV
jgi:hypothetical protein